MIESIDGPNRRVYLDATTVGSTIHPIDFYKAMRELRRTDETLRKYNLFMRADGNIDKGGGKSTERYVTLLEGTRIVPYDTSQVLTITGTLITDDGYEGVYAFDRSELSPSVIVDINYIPPQVEVIEVATAGGVTPQEVWEYNTRELTAASTSSLTQAQNDHLMAIPTEVTVQSIIDTLEGNIGALIGDPTPEADIADMVRALDSGLRQVLTNITDEINDNEATIISSTGMKVTI